MMSALDKWQLKYEHAELSTPAEPCWALKQHLRYLPLKGHALDFAGGLAGNGRFLARCGLKTESWDFSQNATDLVNKWARLQNVNLTADCMDLTQALPSKKFDVIVVSRYLDREVFKSLPNLLNSRGLLITQTFLAPVQESAPSNPAFYVQPSEYQAWWSNQLVCEVYGEGWLSEDNQVRHRYAWYIGRKA